MPRLDNAIEYMRDGERVQLKAIYDRIQPGQMVILYFVGLHNEHPMFSYEQPTVFTVESVPTEMKPFVVGNNITLIDQDGNQVEVGCDIVSYLYDAVEWGVFQYWRLQEKLRRKNGKIAELESKNDMLKDIIRSSMVSPPKTFSTHEQ